MPVKTGVFESCFPYLEDVPSVLQYTGASSMLYRWKEQLDSAGVTVWVRVLPASFLLSIDYVRGI
jgi:hypothetical protein